MNIKIENNSTIKTNEQKLIKHINSILEAVPQAHLRGISRIVLVDRVEDPRLTPSQRAELPGLYRPKMPGSAPWLEIALNTLLYDRTWYKRWGKRIAFRANVTATLLSLIAQHYYLTLSHGVKRTQVEPAVRTYVEKHMAALAESQGGIRATLVKPFKPLLEKFARWARKRYQEELKKQSPGAKAGKRKKSSTGS